MAHPKPDFTIKWGTLDEPIAPIADLDQNEGWSFLGNTPPTAAQFDYMMALYDKRDVWLDENTVKTSDVVQSTGSSTTNVMSQSAVSSQLLGVGQSWQDLTGSRAKNTQYTNTTGRVIFIQVTFQGDSGTVASEMYVDGIRIAFVADTGAGVGVADAPMVAIVPAGSTYQANSNGNLVLWAELR